MTNKETSYLDQSQYPEEGDRSFVDVFTAQVDAFKRQHGDKRFGTDFYRVYNTLLSAKGFGNKLAEVEMRDTQNWISRTVAIALSPLRKNSPVKLAQSKDGLRVAMKYGSFADDGSVELMDQAIETHCAQDNEGFRGSIEYSVHDRKIGSIRGVELEIDFDEKNNALVIRDDPDSRGLAFPLSLNINEEIVRFRKRFDFLVGESKKSQ